jgi:hypothetical protein
MSCRFIRRKLEGIDERRRGSRDPKSPIVLSLTSNAILEPVIGVEGGFVKAFSQYFQRLLLRDRTDFAGIERAKGTHDFWPLIQAESCQSRTRRRDGNSALGSLVSGPNAACQPRVNIFNEVRHVEALPSVD